MIQSTTTPTEPQEAAPGPSYSIDPSNILMNLIVALLAPMFLGVAAGDINLARMAAIETVNAYRSRNHADLIAIAQIIGYGLAALGSLSLSMADDISIAMALRLRGNANALNRSAEQNRRAIRQSLPDTPTRHYQEVPAASVPANERDLAQYEADAMARLADTKRLIAASRTLLRDPEPAPAAPTPAAPTTTALTTTTPTTTTLKTMTPTITDRQKDAAWAAAMADVADEFTASLADLPPAEREMASRRIAALNNVASELLSRPAMPVFRTHPG
jgi:hypothetical protein